MNTKLRLVGYTRAMHVIQAERDAWFVVQGWRHHTSVTRDSASLVCYALVYTASRNEARLHTAIDRLLNLFIYANHRYIDIKYILPFYLMLNILYTV